MSDIVIKHSHAKLYHRWLCDAASRLDRAAHNPTLDANDLRQAMALAVGLMIAARDGLYQDIEDADDSPEAIATTSGLDTPVIREALGIEPTIEEGDIFTGEVTRTGYRCVDEDLEELKEVVSTNR